MEPIKCELCKKAACYQLFNETGIKCPHCKCMKFKKHEIKLTLCNIECSELYWCPEKIISLDANNVKVIYCLEKDECIKCGKRDYPSILFKGKYIGSYCEYCDDFARYKLCNKSDILCSQCDGIKYEKGDKQLILCSTQCQKMSWKPVDYLSKKKCMDTIVEYSLTNDKCPFCKSREDTMAIFEGKYIGVTNNGNKISKYTRMNENY